MTGALKVATAGVSASLMMGALAGGALACEQQGGGGATESSTHAGTGCEQSGNKIVQALTFTTSKGTSSSLSGRVASPDTVVASFTVPANCSVPLTLVSYQAPGATFDAATADKQTVFDHSVDGQTYGAGRHSLTVKVPACYFQVDFVRGSIIDKLGPAGSNNFYSSQGRLIAADNGGSRACQSGSSTSGVSTSACASSSPQLSNVSYLIGGTTTVTDLRGHAGQGESVTATFTVPANCSMQLSLASYTAPLPYFTRQSAPQQVLFQSATSPSGGFTGGVHSLTVTLPACMYQVDFVHGAVLTTLGSTPGTDYEDRLISADNGGSASCSSSSATPTPTPTTTPTPTGTPAPTSTPTTTPTATPTQHTTVTTPTPSAPTGGVQAIATTPTPGGVLGLSTSTPSAGANIAIGSAALLTLVGLAILGLSRIRREEI